MIAADDAVVACFLKRAIGGGGSRNRTYDQRLKRPMLYRLSYTPVRVPAGIIPDQIEMTSAPDRLLAVRVHALDTLFGQPCGSRVGIVGLHPAECTPGIVPAFQLIVAIADFEQRIRHFA